jgi:hypothetical protein
MRVLIKLYYSAAAQIDIILDLYQTIAIIPREAFLYKLEISVINFNQSLGFDLNKDLPILHYENKLWLSRQ